MRRMLIGVAILGSTAGMAQSPPKFERGELVRVQGVEKPAVLKIVGLPDELVHVDETGVYVDDVAVDAGFSKEFLARHKWPRQYIPFGQYFVMGEERTGQQVSEYAGIHPEDSIEKAKP